jgi:hypothetical protein
MQYTVMYVWKRVLRMFIWRTGQPDDRGYIGKAKVTRVEHAHDDVSGSLVLHHVDQPLEGMWRQLPISWALFTRAWGNLI